MIKDFVEFIRKQGIIGLAIGFILGGAVSKVVSSLVQDIINPLLGIILGSTKGLEAAVLTVGSAEIRWGSFVAALVDFVVIALVVYYGFKKLGLEKLDKKRKK
jgi:large conductance mechanosensitive channel